MGMYTELILEGTTSFKNNLPNDVWEMLSYFFGDKGEPPDVLPDHPLFSTPRWDHIGNCSSFYHHPKNFANMHVIDYRDNKYAYLFMRCDLKNYNGEIQLFLDWIEPYLEPGHKGWIHYEEDEKPTLL